MASMYFTSYYLSHWALTKDQSPAAGSHSSVVASCMPPCCVSTSTNHAPFLNVHNGNKELERSSAGSINLLDGSEFTHDLKKEWREGRKERMNARCGEGTVMGKEGERAVWVSGGRSRWVQKEDRMQKHVGERERLADGTSECGLTCVTCRPVSAGRDW
ncbi:hypothetical protein H6P81_007571 [Aristolochia fimbriata]|uniref:Uncharacterized protein n=1 Tax=Aristolochia fimbriata TaxID=158543 RepID=A0AAV7F4G3_ARIFI|nr:hypothetical protein H6P81_007571 [Aristolochia fimbriata]